MQLMITEEGETFSSMVATGKVPMLCEQLLQIKGDSTLAGLLWLDMPTDLPSTFCLKPMLRKEFLMTESRRRFKRLSSKGDGSVCMSAVQT